MAQNKLDITPSVTVHNLLKAYPELEGFLIEMAPPFKKLKNPLLRNTVAKVATLKHISSVGNIPINELIARLRAEVGQSVSSESYSDEDYFGDAPEWFSADRIVFSVNEAEVENKDQMPLVPLLKEVKNVKKGEILELVASFLPAPGIEVMKSKGFLAWSLKEKDDLIKTYFFKNSD